MKEKGASTIHEIFLRCNMNECLLNGGLLTFVAGQVCLCAWCAASWCVLIGRSLYAFRSVVISHVLLCTDGFKN